MCEFKQGNLLEEKTEALVQVGGNEHTIVVRAAFD